jgi:integrase
VFISRLAMRGVPVRVLMELAGHTNISTTMQVYARVGATDARDAQRTAWD